MYVTRARFHERQYAVQSPPYASTIHPHTARLYACFALTFAAQNARLFDLSSFGGNPTQKVTLAAALGVVESGMLMDCQ